MKRLRHPIRAIREPFGTAGLIMACIAIVLALTGAAFAAGKLTSKQKKEVEKIAKKFAGKPGTPGATGPAGPQGAAGANGNDGANGTNGANGKDGVSPTGTEFAGVKSGHCTEGGVEFKGANTTFACNGVKGATGFTDVLPSGKTETGAWFVTGKAQEPTVKGQGSFTISYNIPYPGTTPPTMVYVGEPEVHEEECPGTYLEPAAKPGFLCIYQRLDIVPGPGELLAGASGFLNNTTSGATLFFASKENGETVTIFGTWAVTAP